MPACSLIYLLKRRERTDARSRVSYFLRVTESLPGTRPLARGLLRPATHLGGDAPDVLPVAVARLDGHAVVHAVAQNLLRPLDREVARVARRAQVAHHVLGHLLQLVVVGLDRAGRLALVVALAHPRLRVLSDLTPVLGAAAVLDEPDDGLYGRVGGLRDAHTLGVDAHRLGDVRVLLGRRLIVRPNSRETDAVVQAVVDVVVGADRVRERVQNSQERRTERLRCDVLRPDHP